MIVASKSVRELVEVEFRTLTDPRPRWDSDVSLIAGEGLVGGLKILLSARASALGRFATASQYLCGNEGLNDLWQAVLLT